MKIYISNQLEKIGNVVGLLMVCGILTLAFSLQLDLGELPCPLCLLQRMGFIFIGIGFALNLHFGYRPQHYAICIISAVYTAAVALRQIALHVLPNTGAYGDPIFGLHLYTWSALGAIWFLLMTAFLLFVHHPQNEKIRIASKKNPIIRICAFLFALIILANVVVVFLECGLSVCPDNPKTYEIIERIMN